MSVGSNLKLQLTTTILDCNTIRMTPHSITDQVCCYFLLGDISRAIETLTKAIWRKSDYDFPHYFRGRCYSIQGDYKRQHHRL